LFEPVAKRKLWFRENLQFIERNLPLSLFSKNLQFLFKLKENNLTFFR